MDKRTSPRAIYDAAVRWIATNHDRRETLHSKHVIRMVAEVFDVAPAAVTRHVMRVYDGSAPPQFHMPTSESARRARNARQAEQELWAKNLEQAGVVVGSRWSDASHLHLPGEITRISIKNASVTIWNERFGWVTEWPAKDFLERYIRILPVETQEVTP